MTPEEAERMGQALVELSWRKPEQLQEIRDLIDSGANIDARGQLGRCALSLAIGAHNIQVAKLLLESGANPNNADDFGRGPLFWATGASETGIIPLLMAKGANINAQDHDGYTALMDATISGKGVIVQFLVAHGAKLDMQSAYGHSALTLACLNLQRDVDQGHAGIIRLLADAGADPSLKNREGKTCLDFLRERGHDELLSYVESAPARREAARPKINVPKPKTPIKLKPNPPRT
jgi:uncharacterized protein